MYNYVCIHMCVNHNNDNNNDNNDMSYDNDTIVVIVVIIMILLTIITITKTMIMMVVMVRILILVVFFQSGGDALKLSRRRILGRTSFAQTFKPCSNNEQRTHTMQI